MVRFVSFALAFAITALAFADDASADRERRVKVALAIANSKVTPTAPAPHAAYPCYAEGYRTALKSGSPLVVFVGCKGQHPIPEIEGAVVSAAPELPGYKAGSIVVAYPAADSLLVEATFECNQHDSPKLTDAVKAATRKVERPVKGDKVAPRPLSWEI